MQPIISNEIQLPDGRIGVPIYIQPQTQTVILAQHVIILRICASFQVGVGVLVQLGYLCDFFIGILSSPFGIVSFATGIIGLSLTYNMRLRCLNGTYLGFSIATALYAFGHGIIAALFDQGLFCIVSSVITFTGLIMSIVACVYCCKTNSCCLASTVQMYYPGNYPNPMHLQPVQQNVERIQCQQAINMAAACEVKVESPPEYEE